MGINNKLLEISSQFPSFSCRSALSLLIHAPIAKILLPSLSPAIIHSVYCNSRRLVFSCSTWASIAAWCASASEFLHTDHQRIYSQRQQQLHLHLAVLSLNPLTSIQQSSLDQFSESKYTRHATCSWIRSHYHIL